MVNKDIQTAALLIKNDGLVAFPTETVYGLGARKITLDDINDALPGIFVFETNKPGKLIAHRITKKPLFTFETFIFLQILMSLLLNQGWAWL